LNDQGVGLGLMISNILAKRLTLNPALNEQKEAGGLKVYSEGVGSGT